MSLRAPEREASLSQGAGSSDSLRGMRNNCARRPPTSVPDVALVAPD